MIKLRINDIAKSITGYEILNPESHIYQSDIVVDENKIDLQGLSEGMTAHNAYYRNGTVEAGELAPDWKELLALRKKIAASKESVDNEHKILMDNLIVGMSMEEATATAKENREELNRLTTEHKEICKRQEHQLFDYWAKKHQEEESELTWKYYSAAVLLIRDENKYLQEWLDWHLGIGFDHIYIYDNGVEENVMNVISDDITNRVTVIPRHTEYNNVQEDAYNHFLQNYGQEVRWVNFIDSDEFVRFTDPGMTVNSLLVEYEDYTEFYAGFTEYNASGQESYAEAPVRERFMEVNNVNAYLYHKDFVQPHRVDFMDRHYPRYGERGNYVYRDDQDNKDLVVIDHYYTKSWEEWQEKIARGSSDPNYLKQLNEFFVYNPDMAYLKRENQIQQYKNY